MKDSWQSGVGFGVTRGEYGGRRGRVITALVGDTLLDFLDMFIRSILFKTNLPSLTALSTML